MTGRKLPPLAALRAFEATARHLSAKRAADELAVTPTAVSHQLRQLESHLNVALFVRQPRQLILTAPGKLLFEGLREGFDLFDAALAKVRTGEARQTVTLSTTPALAAHWLLPHVPAFRQRYPGYDLRIHVSHEAVALDGRTADLAIRYGKGRWPGLVAEKLFDNAFAPVCSPVLKLRRPSALAHHTLIHFEWQPRVRPAPDWRAWRAAAGLPSLETDRGLFFSDESHAMQAAVAAQGVALLGLGLIADELARGVLVQPFGPVLPGHPFFLVHPEGRGQEPAVQAARDWVMGLRPQ